MAAALWGKRFVACSAALIFAAGGSGCTTLLDPYVRDTKLDDASSSLGAGVDRLEKVVEAAEAQRTAYYRAVSERAKLRNALPMVLLPLGALTLYRGITTGTDAGRRDVLLFGLLGAAVYATGNAYLAAPRERIYLGGVLALSCAIHAVEPYLAAKGGYDSFKTDLPQLDLAVEQVEYLRRQIAELRPQVPAGNVAALADSQRPVAQALATRGRRVAATAHKLDAQIGNAAINFRYAVERIVDRVSRQVEATDPDPSATLRAVGSLPMLGAELAHVSALRLDAVGAQLGDIKAQTEPERITVVMGRLLDELAKANQNLMTLMAGVASFNATVLNAIKNASKLESCTVPEVANELIISPPDDTVALKAGIAQVFRVRGNSGIPDAALVGALGDSSDPGKDAVKIVGKTVEGNVLVVRVLQERAIPGLQQAILEFSANDRTTGARRQVTLNLDSEPAKPAAKPGAEPKPAPKPEPAPQPEPAAKPAKPGADDGKVGPRNADPQSGYETKTLTVGKLREVQQKLGEEPDGVFGNRTRAAIRQFQARVPGAKADGRLTAELVERILQSN